MQADITQGMPEELHARFDRIVSTYVFHEFPMEEKVALLTRLTEQSLAAGGFLVVGDVGFPDREAHDLARQHWADR